MVHSVTEKNKSKEDDKKLLKILNDSILGKDILRHRSTDEINRIWTSLYTKYQEQLKNVLRKKGNVSSLKRVPLEFQTTVYHLVFLAQETATFEESKIPSDFNNFVSELHLLLLNKNIKLRLSLEICKLYSALHSQGYLRGDIQYTSLLYYYLSNVNLRKQPRSVVRLWKHRSYTKRVNWNSQTAQPVLQLALSLTEKNWFLNFHLGREFIVSLILASDDFAKEFVSLLKKVINKPNYYSNFTQYGRICSSAYNLGKLKVKELIKTTLIFILETMFSVKIGSNSLESKTQSKNCMAYVKDFMTDDECVKANEMFSREMTLRIWGYLEQDKKMSRSNACCIFFEHYPLEWHGQSRPLDQEGYFNYQNKHITTLLLDSCHLVRAQAAQGVGKILSKLWNLIPYNFVLEWMKIITEDLAYDDSSHLVRKAAFICFQEMLNEPKADETLLRFIPQLKDCLSDDKNETVQAEFLNLLFKIKKLDRFKYWDVMPIERLISCLAIESEGSKEVIVDLLYNSYLLKDEDPDRLFNRLMLLLALDYKCGKVFFEHSRRCLNAQDAASIIDTIVANIDKHVMDTHFYGKKYADVCRTITVNSDEPPTMCRRTDCSLADDITVFDKDTSCNKRVTKVNSSANLHNPNIMLGLVDILDIMWERHMDRSKVPGNIVNKLQIAFRLVFPQWFTYFQGTEVFVPLMKFMCRLPLHDEPCDHMLVVHYCLNRLDRMTTMERSDLSSQYLGTLCFVGHVDRILSLVAKMLEEVLTIPSWTDHSKLKISFEDNGSLYDSLFARPMVALTFLNCVFKNPSLRDILKPHLDSIFTFWKQLGKIKQLISWRLTLQDVSSYNVFCIDEFIEKCFYRYVKFIPLLECINKDMLRSYGCNSVQMFIQLLEWTEQLFFPLIPKSLPLHKEDNPNFRLLTNLQQYLLYVVTDMTDMGICGTNFIIKMCSYLSTICEQESGLPLVVLAVNYCWAATSFLYSYYRNITGINIINANIIPLLSTIMKMIANIQDDKLIFQWVEKEDTFWNYIGMTMHKMHYFCNERSEASTCFPNAVFAITSPAIIPLRTQIVNRTTAQCPVPRVTRKLLSLLTDKAIVRRMYSKIFTDSMNEHSQKEVDTLLAELNFLMLIILGIPNMDINEKIRMFRVAKKSWEMYLSMCIENNSHISEQHIQMADDFFQSMEEYIERV